MNGRVGLLGGSFDPIHFGHLISARSIAEQLNFTKLVLIPSARPPHKLKVALTDAQHRLAMTKLAVQGDPLFDVSDMELHRSGPSYTFDTVTAFRKQLGEQVELFWLIGADSLPELPTWYRIAELVQIVQIVTAARPGWSPPPVEDLAKVIGAEHAEKLFRNCLLTPQIEISATDIRRRVKDGRSIRFLTPDAVTSYIAQNRIYTF